MDWFDEHIQFTTVEPDVFVRVGELILLLTIVAAIYTAVAKC